MYGLPLLKSPPAMPTMEACFHHVVAGDMGLRTSAGAPNLCSGPQRFGVSVGRSGVGALPGDSEHPKSPSSSIAYTWALKEFLHPYFGAYVSTRELLGPFGAAVEVICC